LHRKKTQEIQCDNVASCAERSTCFRPRTNCPITGKAFTKVARSTAEDIELALDAAHAAKAAWNNSSSTERSNILLKIADRMEANLELLAYAETVDNGRRSARTRRRHF
jgi:acyl-CoA reductase-like NAD-dependent aldehyde dehydrogenase